MNLLSFYRLKFIFWEKKIRTDFYNIIIISVKKNQSKIRKVKYKMIEKIEIKSYDGKYLRNQNLVKIFKWIKNEIWDIYRDKNFFMVEIIKSHVQTWNPYV